MIRPLDAAVEPEAAVDPIIAGLSVGAAAIHAAVIDVHFNESVAPGVFFIVAALFQLLWAIGWWLVTIQR